jgi:hypothetical protein
VTVTAQRIPTWRYALADLATTWFGTPHRGASDDWRPLIELGDQPTVAIGIARVHRQPIAALTATGHYERYDDLGGWNPSQTDLDEPHIYNALTASVNTVNTGSTR